MGLPLPFPHTPSHGKHKLCHPRPHLTLSSNLTAKPACTTGPPTPTLGTASPTQGFAHGIQTGPRCTLLERGPGRAGEIHGRESAAKWKSIRKVKIKKKKKKRKLVYNCINLKASMLCSGLFFYHFASNY